MQAFDTTQNNFQGLTDSLPGIVYRCRNDANFSVIYLSDYCYKLLGYTPEEFTSGAVSFSQLIHPEDLLQVTAEVEKAVADRRPFQLIYRVQARNAEWLWVEDNGAGIYKDEKLLFLQGFISDISAQQKLKLEAEILSGFSRSLAAVDNMDSLGDAVHNVISSLFQWHAFFISIRQSGQKRVRVVLEADLYPEGIKYQRQRITTLPEGIRQDVPSLILRPVGASDVGGNRFGDIERASQSLMFAPLSIVKRHIGVLSVQSYEAYRYNNSDLALLQNIGEYLAPAVERVRAEELSRAFSSLGEELNAALTPEQVALIMVRYADRLIGWDACGIEQYSTHEHLLRDLIGFDIIEGHRVQLGKRLEPLQPAGYQEEALNTGYVLINRKPSSVIKTSSNAFGDVDRPSASIMFVTMYGSAGVTGVVALHSYTFNAFDLEDVNVLQALGNICGNAFERTQAQQQLLLREEIYRNAITAAGAVPYQLDYLANEYVFVGEGIESITGWKASEFSTSVWKSMVQEVVMLGNTEDASVEIIAQEIRDRKRTSWKADIRIITKSGEERWVSDTSVELFGEHNTAAGSLGILQDITDRKRYETALLYDSMHDSLTGLANRVLLLEHLRLALHRAHRRSNSRFALLFIDIDRFKHINDSLGHLAGDELLKITANKLSNSVRPGDTVARFAGDEFVVLLDDMQHLEDVLPVAERILREVKQPVRIDGQEVSCSISMGIVLSSASYEKPEDLLRDSDNALYQAKAKGKGRYEIFNAGMYLDAVKALALENDLRRALDRKEFILHFQPIFNLETGDVVQLEALVRWNHPERSMIYPGDFISIAEETRLIIPLGLWVVEEAVRFLRELRQNFPQWTKVQMSVNMSVVQFESHNLAQLLRDIVVSGGLKPKDLVLEITETILLDKGHSVVTLLNELAEFGFVLSLDDFGAGYSSLSSLYGLPIHSIKIDRSFIGQLEMSDREREIVKAIIHLAKQLGIGVTAEGVETDGQVTLLREMECDHVQGYFFSKPVDPIAIKEFLL